MPSHPDRVRRNYSGNNTALCKFCAMLFTPNHYIVLNINGVILHYCSLRCRDRAAECIKINDRNQSQLKE